MTHLKEHVSEAMNAGMKQLASVSQQVAEGSQRLAEFAQNAARGSAACVDGVTNLRGQITTVTDLRRRFGLPEKEKDDRSRIIIEPEGIPIGMVVDPGSSEVLAGCLQRIPEPVPDLVTESGGKRHRCGM